MMNFNIKFNQQLFNAVSLILILFLSSCQNETKIKESSSSYNTVDTLKLFNGADLTGWNNNYPDNWLVEDGILVGTTMEKLLDQAIWITTTEEYSDFILTFQVKLTGDENKNSGVYYRGQWDDKHVVGYELDIGGWGDEESAVWWGQLHDPYRREDLWIGPEGKELDGVYNENNWNKIKIVAQGNHIQHWVNETQTVDWYEQDPKIQRKGFIGFQLHDETRNKVYVKDIELINLNRDIK